MHRVRVNTVLFGVARQTVSVACLCLALPLSRGQSPPPAGAGESFGTGQAEQSPSNDDAPNLTGALPEIEGAVHGFPALYDQPGLKLADGEFLQWPEDDRLHITNTYEFDAGRRIVESMVVRVQPRVIQESWSWTETANGDLVRRFAVDFVTGRATGEKRTGKETKRWTENISVHPGRTFAGAAFVLVLKSLGKQLREGERIELEAVGFTPKPRVISVELYFDGRDELAMAGRKVMGDRFIIHPKIPVIAKLFVDVSDTRIWLTATGPVSFLRWEGPLVEASDPIVRSDLLPGITSRPAQPVSAGRTDQTAGPP